MLTSSRAIKFSLTPWSVTGETSGPLAIRGSGRPRPGGARGEGDFHDGSSVASVDHSEGRPPHRRLPPWSWRVRRTRQRGYRDDRPAGLLAGPDGHHHRQRLGAG